MQNYFNYFTEIEHKFQQRRGSLLMLSTLDWALIETWRQAGVPLAAVLRGIDTAFNRHEAKKKRGRKVNGLAWAAQSVMEAFELGREASVGVAVPIERKTGFEMEPVRAFLVANASAIEATGCSAETVTRLRELADMAHEMTLEDLERTLSVLEEKLLASVMTAATESDLMNMRQLVARELAPYRGKMQAVQIRQLQQQILQKKLFEAKGLPRLSIFYMNLHWAEDTPDSDQ